MKIDYKEEYLSEQNRRQELAEINDQLLEALKAMVASPYGTGPTQKERTAARKAIARAEAQ